MDSLLLINPSDVVASIVYVMSFSIMFSFLMALFRFIVFAGLERKEF